MNYTKLSEKELIEVINSEQDLVKLEAAENEWVRRFCPVDTNLDDEHNEDIIEQIYKVWRDN